MSLSMASCRSSTGPSSNLDATAKRPPGIPFHPPAMPELPDLEAYLAALRARIAGQTLEGFRSSSPFLVRSVAPPPAAAVGKRVERLARLGKRIVIGFEDELAFVFHLMIAGRLHWRARDASVRGRNALAALDFPSGTLLLTEAGTKRRASLHVVRGEAELAAHDPGGVEPLEVDLAAFREALLRERHTLKRALTDPRLFAGIGNAYSDEILHRARMSPFLRAHELDEASIERLWTATRDVLGEWRDRFVREAEERFPERVTAFPEGMAVHGRWKQPCPACGAPVQRIVHAENESNYCARCQTGGRILADRALSRLLHDDWPTSIDELG
jgi:formamidopyrimidine-DNA glycosylase